MRIRETGGFDLGAYADLQYVVLERLPRLSKKQVLCVYLFAAGLITLLITGALYLPSDLAFLLLAPGPLMALIPFLLRRRAKKKVPGIRPTSATTGM
jgi:hypothetical protein